MRQLLGLALVPLLFASRANSDPETRWSLGLGVGGYAAPLPAGATDAGTRSTFLLDAAVERKVQPTVRLALWEFGAFGGGTLHPGVGQSADEWLLASNSIAALEYEWVVPEQQGTLTAAAGGGAIYVHDQIDHGDASLEASGWGPAALLQVVWWGDLTPALAYRVRVAWNWGQTDLPVQGNPGTRLVSDWSRLELGLGVGF
jgi:hypothetical protein